MIKKTISILFVTIISIFFVSSVNAAELDFSNVASLTSVIGGSDEEIVQIADGTYKYYYKVQVIDDSDFNTYIKSKYIVDNEDESTDDYVVAQSRVAEYEETFNGLIPTINSTSDLNNWTESTDKQINLSNLNYTAGKHSGYILAVAAVKDQSIYVTRVILESTSATTLGNITYNESDATTITTNTNSNTQTTTVETETRTTSNPETGLDDYAIYLVPLSIVMGSVLLLRRNFA